jgi:hypothetical protein
MFCSNCGNPVSEGSVKCANCNAALGVTIKPQGSAGKGFLVLLISFFTMPLKTLKMTIQQLKELGEKGRLDIKETDIPHLTWLGIAGNFVASLVIVLIVTAGVIKGLLSLGDLDHAVEKALFWLIINPIGGVLFAILANWIIMLWLEILLLLVYISKDIKKIANKS